MKRSYLLLCIAMLFIILTGCQNQEKTAAIKETAQPNPTREKDESSTDKNPIQVINEKNAAEMDELIQSVNKYEQEHKPDITARNTEACYAEAYTISLQLDRKGKRLSGKMQVTIKNHTRKDLSEICIRNYAGAVLWEYGKGTSKIYNCTVNEKKDGLSLTRKKKDASVLYLKSKGILLPAGESAVIGLEFATDIPKKKDRFGYVKYDGREFYQLSFCFPSISVYENGKWNENPYVNSSSESNYTKCSDYDVTIQPPEGFDVIATGTETVEGQTVRITGKNLREPAIVISNGLVRKTATVKGVTINNYGLDYAKNEAYNNLSLQAAIDSIELYTDLFGAYPYEEFDIVQTFMKSTGAMEYPGMVMYGLPDVGTKKYKNLDKAASYDIRTCCNIAHETAHQWFYGAVGSDPYKEPWLDEGFANYCETILYLQSGKKSVSDCAVNDDSDSTYGKQSNEEFQKDRQMMIEQTMRNKPINLKLDSYDFSETEYTVCVYEGGGTFLYELQKAMGDTKFFYSVRQYIKTYYLKEATTADFLSIIRKTDSSEKIERVIKKYVE